MAENLDSLDISRNTGIKIKDSLHDSMTAVTHLYSEWEDTPASSSVLTWRILARVVRMMSESLESLDISRNTGIKIEDLCDIDLLDLHRLNVKECSSFSAEGFLSIYFFSGNKP